MAIDASIPLAVKQFQVDTPFQLAEGVNQVNNGQQRNALIGEQILGQQQHRQVVDNQLRSASILQSAASQPGSFTPDGMPSNALIAQVARSGDVDAMNSLVTHASAVQQKRALAEQEHAKALKTQQETYEKYGKMIDEGMGKVRRYDEILKNAGMPDDQRQSAADAMWSKTLEDWDKSAAIDKTTLARAPKTYNAPGFAASSEAYQKWDLEKQKAGNAGSKFTAPKWTDTKGLLYRPTQDGGLEVMDPTDNKWKGINQAPSDLMNLGVQSPTLVAEKAGKSAEARAEHPMPPSGYANAPGDPTALVPRPGGPVEVKQQAVANKTTMEDQRRLDKIAKDYAIPQYRQGETIADRAERQLTDPAQGYQSVTPEQARALVNQGKLMMDNYRARTGGKYQDDQVNRMNSMLERVGKFVETIGEGEKILAKDEMLNLAKEMKSIYADRNADLLKTELAIAHSTQEKGGKSSLLTLQGKIDDAVKYGRARKKSIDGKDYLSFAKKGEPATSENTFELPSKE